MIDHLSFSVKNYEESRTFYDATLKILGYERLMEFDNPEHQAVTEKTVKPLSGSALRKKRRCKETNSETQKDLMWPCSFYSSDRDVV